MTNKALNLSKQKLSAKRIEKFVKLFLYVIDVCSEIRNEELHIFVLSKFFILYEAMKSIHVIINEYINF